MKCSIFTYIYLYDLYLSYIHESTKSKINSQASAANSSDLGNTASQTELTHFNWNLPLIVKPDMSNVRKIINH